MSFKFECTPALKVANVPLFSTDDGKFLVADHAHPSSATDSLKPAHWFTYWELVSVAVLTSVNRTIYKSLLCCGVQVKCEGVTMATAAASPLASSVEKTNGAKLSRLLIHGGTTVLRNMFDAHHPSANLAADLHARYSILNYLLRQRVLNSDQWNKLFPPGGTPPASSTFDITLLFLLLTNICGLSPPPTGWHKEPTPSDTSLEANLARCDKRGKVEKVFKVGDDSDGFLVCRRPFVNASDKSLHKTIIDVTHPDGRHHNIVLVKYEFVGAPEHEVKVKHHGNAVSLT